MAEKSCKEDTSADRSVKECLQAVKVSKQDATRLQLELQKEIFQSFSERCEVITIKKVLFSNINKYLDHLQRSCEGIDCNVRKMIDTTLLEEQTWNSKMIEWKYRNSDDSGAGYSMVAFGRSNNQQYVDVMSIFYKMKYALNRKVDVKKFEQAWFNRAYPFTSDEITYEDVPRELGSIKPMLNWFRVKALEGFLDKGCIKSIDYVNSLDDIPESTAE